MRGAIAGLILAGGQSRRMGGGEKFLLEIDGQTLLSRAIARLKPQVAQLALSANCDPALLAAYPFPVLPDAPPAGRGPLAGILAGLDWASARTGITHLAVAPSDTPFFPADLLERLARDQKRIVLASSDNRVHPVFGLWPLTVRQALRRWLADGDNLKVMDFIETQSWIQIDFATEPDGDPFFNVNTPDDLAIARNRAAEHDA